METTDKKTKTSYLEKQKTQLALFEEGKRSCAVCNEIKDLKDFNKRLDVKIIERDYKCKQCCKKSFIKHKIKLGKEKDKQQQEYVNNVRNSEWYQNYLKNKGEKNKNEKNGKAMNNFFKGVKKTAYLTFHE